MSVRTDACVGRSETRVIPAPRAKGKLRSRPMSDPRSALRAENLTPLLLGHTTFRSEYFQHDRELYETLAAGRHEPTALIISCCDARVVPDVILNADPGDLFVLRNIANLVPAFGSGAHKSVGAAIEYAIHGLKVPHVIVCGHTQCGGLGAMAKGYAHLAAHMPSLADWLHDAVELRERVAEMTRAKGTDGATLDADALWQQLVYENVAVQLENLLTYPAVRWGLERGAIELHGWVYRLEDGGLSSYDAGSNSFRSLGGRPSKPTAATPGP